MINVGLAQARPNYRLIPYTYYIVHGLIYTSGPLHIGDRDRSYRLKAIVTQQY